MADKNNLISWANLDHNQVGSYDSGEIQTSPLFLYISACSFQITISCTSSGSAVSCRATLSWYDWSSKSWTEAGYISTSILTTGTKQNQFNHNFQGQNSEIDKNTYHLWKVQFTSTCRSTNTARIQVVYGNAGFLTEAQYNSLCKGKLIVSAGNLEGPCLIEADTKSDSTAIETFNFEKDRGKSITASYAHKLIPKSWE